MIDAQFHPSQQTRVPGGPGETTAPLSVPVGSVAVLEPDTCRLVLQMPVRGCVCVGLLSTLPLRPSLLPLYPVCGRASLFARPRPPGLMPGLGCDKGGFSGYPSVRLFLNILHLLWSAGMEWLGGRSESRQLFKVLGRAHQSRSVTDLSFTPVSS